MSRFHSVSSGRACHLNGNTGEKSNATVHPCVKCFGGKFMSFCLGLSFSLALGKCELSEEFWLK